MQTPLFVTKFHKYFKTLKKWLQEANAETALLDL